jgi:hypothetical protein
MWATDTVLPQASRRGEGQLYKFIGSSKYFRRMSFLQIHLLRSCRMLDSGELRELTHPETPRLA